METRTIYLLVYPGQRFHFGLWTPDTDASSTGTKTQVIGNPMTGFALQFKRGYTPGKEAPSPRRVAIGTIDAAHVQTNGGGKGEDSVPVNELERVAEGIRPPGPSENFLAPVNETTNRRCQEWTMEVVRRLVEVGYLSEEAVGIVQKERNAPGDGLG